MAGNIIHATAETQEEVARRMRTSVRVSKPPGGVDVGVDAALRAHTGADDGTTNAAEGGVHTSVRVTQPSGGSSTVGTLVEQSPMGAQETAALAHPHTGIHVSQTPGGDSVAQQSIYASPSRGDGDGGGDGGGGGGGDGAGAVSPPPPHSSIRVTQAPGGDSVPRHILFSDDSAPLPPYVPDAAPGSSQAVVGGTNVGVGDGTSLPGVGAPTGTGAGTGTGTGTGAGAGVGVGVGVGASGVERGELHRSAIAVARAHSDQVTELMDMAPRPDLTSPVGGSNSGSRDKDTIGNNSTDGNQATPALLQQAIHIAGTTPLRSEEQAHPAASGGDDDDGLPGDGAPSSRTLGAAVSTRARPMLGRDADAVATALVDHVGKILGSPPMKVSAGGLGDPAGTAGVGGDGGGDGGVAGVGVGGGGGSRGASAPASDEGAQAEDIGAQELFEIAGHRRAQQASGGTSTAGDVLYGDGKGGPFTVGGAHTCCSRARVVVVGCCVFACGCLVRCCRVCGLCVFVCVCVCLCVFVLCFVCEHRGSARVATKLTPP